MNRMASQAEDQASMNAVDRSSLRTLGLYSGLVALITSIAYGIPQILSVVGVLEEPWDLLLMFAPSLVLSWSVVVLMVCIHHYASSDKKIWSHLGMVFAVVYAVMVGIVYFSQLTVVIPAMFEDETTGLETQLFEEGTVMVAVDGLGYGMLSISTLFAAKVFAGGKLETRTRWAMTANGALAPVVMLAVMWPIFLAIGVFWLVTFPLSAALITKVFHRLR